PSLPADVRKAWEQAGGSVAGWTAPERYGTRALRGKRYEKGDVPAVAFLGAVKGGLGALPPIAQPFGLILDFAVQKDLEAVGALENVRTLHVSGPQVTDGALAHLTRAKHLQAISVGNTKITDGGLKHLAALPDLREIGLVWENVTDAGLMNLTPLEGLRG